MFLDFCATPFATSRYVTTLPSADLRLSSLAQWVASTLGTDDFAMAPASADASFRRYFRLTLREPHGIAQDVATLIVMDAPPPMEDCVPFIHVARLLHDAGVNVPRVLAQDLQRGFLLLTDLGPTTYLAALDASTARALYGDAFSALVRFQGVSCAGELPPYDEAMLRRELEIFPEWYVTRHLGCTLSEPQRAVLDRVFTQIVASNLAQPRVFVHRDYHSRNLMVSSPNPGVLDFQGAMYGPVTYDAVSLMRDAYIEWDEEEELDWTIRYWERARAAALPVHGDFGDFWRDFEWMGVQRHLKVLGIFARLSHRDGKDSYIRDMPRTLRHLRRACARYRDLEPINTLLDTLTDRVPAIGHTF